MTRSFTSVFGAATLMAMLALGGMAPAAAQSPGLNFGDRDSEFFFGEDNDRDGYPERMLCLTDRQVRNAIASRGYTDISLNVVVVDEVQVRATIDGWVYLLDYNLCADRIEGRQRLRRAG